MEPLWYVLVVVLFSGYVVLDGFDLGAGILHFLVAKTEEERGRVLSAIGPFWDGNEVWLIAGGGTLFFAFPRAYAVGFSGFYLPLMLALWLLILRGLGIELRGHEANRLWRQFWDAVFFFGSSLLTLTLGVSLGNLIRGVPLDAQGHFQMGLFTDFRAGTHPGVFDWYTLLVGVFTMVVLAAHGALFLAWKTDGALSERAILAAKKAHGCALLLLLPVTLSTHWVNPHLFSVMLHRPAGWPLFVTALASATVSAWAMRRGRALLAFLASATFLFTLLVGVAIGSYPVLLRSTIDSAFNLDIGHAAAGTMSLRLGLLWWSFAFLLVLGYFVLMFRAFRGKVR